MRVHRIATATMLVLAVSGWGVTGSGAAYAETGPGHGGKAKAAEKGHHPAHGGRAKARAEGGSTTGGALFQQNIAQSARQNNSCNNPNMEDATISLTDSRATGRCVTTDGSLTAFSRIHNGPAEVEGGDASETGLAEQNTAQRGRQNNNCNNVNATGITVSGSRVKGHCTDQDLSITKHTSIKGGGARAHSGTSGGSTSSQAVTQQNTAQEGRQNNTCNSPSFTAFEPIAVTGGGRVSARCENKDASFTTHTSIKGGGARAHGGSSGEVSLNGQNVAQEGRQNNTCNSSSADSPDALEVTGGRVKARCGNKDNSFSKHTHIKGGGARAQGGSTTGGAGPQQNTAQEGRQNNTCNNTNVRISSPLEVTGGHVEGRCGNKDTSFSEHTYIKGGGARAQGGFTTPGGDSDMNEQNIAQEGRQNNSCSNTNDVTITVPEGGRVQGRCGNKDASFNKHTRTKGGGARAHGGSGGDINMYQQNIAQEGRQNNTCNNINIASGTINVDGARVKSHCGNKDFSFNRKTFVKAGGARAEGGSTGTGVDFAQQNIAQEGRQNNSCNNHNLPAGTTDLGDSRSNMRCQTVDRSVNLHTADIGGGAKTTGGNSTAEIFQQNIAQEGRQNNTCNNTNNLTLTTTGSRLHTPCAAVDRSTNIGTEYR
ncbi:hypothetical protein [Streptomyces sp. NPDC051776]|uniref:hypothetical protein n=1 Tax=Streptomyces sp. NPDC051776 TaxID=3155414 RepID=UPI003418EB94